MLTVAARSAGPGVIGTLQTSGNACSLVRLITLIALGRDLGARSQVSGAVVLENEGPM